MRLKKLLLSTALVLASLSSQFALADVAPAPPAIDHASATHDAVLPFVTDEETVDWATENLSAFGWEFGHSTATSPEEQRANPLVGDAQTGFVTEVDTTWVRDGYGAVDPVLETEWLNFVTGYDTSIVTFDKDDDEIEVPFDAFPSEFLQWKDENPIAAKLLTEETPVFDIAAYDYDHNVGPPEVTSVAPCSDRNMFDTFWDRDAALGNQAMDEYLLQRERSMDLPEIWSTLFVYRLASGCAHCEALGVFGIWGYTEPDNFWAEIPEDEQAPLIAYIRSLMDFESSEQLVDEPAFKVALRFARDTGRLPTRVTAALIEELWHYHSDRQAQEILAIPVVASWLSGSMKSTAVVTEELRMSWTLRHLGPPGWRPGVHLGLPSEQWLHNVSELADLLLSEINSGRVLGTFSEWNDALTSPAIDAGKYGVEDAFDGLPDDSSRGADTDFDGKEDA